MSTYFPPLGWGAGRSQIFTFASPWGRGMSSKNLPISVSHCRTNLLLRESLKTFFLIAVGIRDCSDHCIPRLVINMLSSVWHVPPSQLVSENWLPSQKRMASYFCFPAQSFYFPSTCPPPHHQADFGPSWNCSRKMRN